MKRACIHHIERFRKWVVVSGARSVKVDDTNRLLEVFKEKLGVEHQLLDADYIASPKHLLSSAYHALAAFELGENIARSLAMEVLLYASANRQISEALSLLGLKTGMRNVAFVAICETEEEAKRCARLFSDLVGESKVSMEVLEVTPSKASLIKEAFDIGDDEVLVLTSMGINEEEALVEIVLERVALLAARR